MLTTAAVIVFTILLSAFFSGMEIAFLSANKLKLEIEKKQSKLFNYIANLFTRNSGQYITTILVGNNVALVVYSIQMVVLLDYIFAKYGIHLTNAIFIETVISTIIIIFAAEFIPKSIVRANPNFYFRIFAFPGYFFYLLFYPISKFSTFISKLTLKVFGIKISQGNKTTFDKLDLAHLLDEASDNNDNSGKNDSHGNDIKLFQNALEFPDTLARDCMIPRIDICAVDINDPIETVVKTFVESHYSRVIVYEGSIDNIVGYLNSKSLFTKPSTISEILRPLTYVPETMPVNTIFADFIKHNNSVSVVIDEFGGTAGLITIEDILEEIFGEIEDEHDSPDLIETVVNDKEYIFSSRLEIDYLNDRYQLNIPESDDYDTLGGYIIFNHKGLPEEGETINIGNKTINILEMGGSKIDLVKIIVE